MHDITEIESILCDTAVAEICQGGDNHGAVKRWTKHYIHTLLENDIMPEDCESMLEEYSFTDDPHTVLELYERTIWWAAWNVFEYNDLRVS